MLLGAWNGFCSRCVDLGIKIASPFIGGVRLITVIALSVQCVLNEIEIEICDPPRRNESHVAEVDFTGDRKNLITPRILHLHL